MTGARHMEFAEARDFIQYHCPAITAPPAHILLAWTVTNDFIMRDWFYMMFIPERDLTPAGRKFFRRLHAQR